MRDLTPAEQQVLDLLGRAAHEHSRLPAIHPADSGEFVAVIHAAQNIVLARPATEAQAHVRALEGLAPGPGA